MDTADVVGIVSLLVILLMAGVFVLMWRRGSGHHDDEDSADQYRRDLSYLGRESARRRARRKRAVRRGGADVWAAGATPAPGHSRARRFVARVTLGAFGAYSLSPPGGAGADEAGGDSGCGGGCGGGGCGGGGCGGG